jgi:hypothetical protein
MSTIDYETDRNGRSASPPLRLKISDPYLPKIHEKGYLNAK